MNRTDKTISVITVTYNAEDLIEVTVNSVIKQTYPHVEYIIIDGNSVDNTLQIINKYTDHIHTLISESDSGLYDAMNKGMRIATGDFIIFMNAGDSFYSDQTLENVFQNAAADIYFGDAMMINEDGESVGLRSKITTRRLPEKLTWRSMARGMVVCHQAIIVKRTLAPNFIQDNLSADIDWIIKCLKCSKTVCNTHSVICNYLLGGISQKRHWKSLRERYLLLQRHYGFLPNLMNHTWIILRWIHARLTKNILID